MEVGIWGYGVSIPSRRIAVETINHVWQNIPLETVKRLNVKERTVLGPDEDTVTLAADAAFGALTMSEMQREQVGALFFGTQTSPYLTRPAAAILVDALGLDGNVFAADVQFSGKSGVSALLMAVAYVRAGMAEAAIAIGADTLSSHVSPGDSLEYTAAAGAGAVVVSSGAGLATVEAHGSYTSDTPDRFRLDGERYIRTGGSAMTNSSVGMRKHVARAWQALITEETAKSGQPCGADDFKYLVIQQLDGRGPFDIGRTLGFTKEQIVPGIVVDRVGDCGAATPLISLARVLDQALPDERVAVVSYGFGAGSDVVTLRTSPSVSRVGRKRIVDALIQKRVVIDYANYIKLERKYHTHERKVGTFD